MTVAAALVAGAVAYLALAVPLAIVVGLCLRGRCVPVGEPRVQVGAPRTVGRIGAEAGAGGRSGPSQTMKNDSGNALPESFCYLRDSGDAA